MDQINFLRKYFNDYRNLTLFDNKTLELIVKTKKNLIKLKRDKKKALIFGNGGRQPLQAILCRFDKEC